MERRPMSVADTGASARAGGAKKWMRSLAWITTRRRGRSETKSRFLAGSRTIPEKRRTLYRAGLRLGRGSPLRILQFGEMLMAAHQQGFRAQTQRGDRAGNDLGRPLGGKAERTHHHREHVRDVTGSDVTGGQPRDDDERATDHHIER